MPLKKYVSSEIKILVADKVLVAFFSLSTYIQLKSTDGNQLQVPGQFG